MLDLTFLESLDSIDHAVCFSEELPIMGSEDLQRIGTMNISISSSEYQGEPCYYVDNILEVQLEGSNYFNSTITSYVSSSLTTLSEAIYTIVKEDSVKEHMIELSREPDGSVALSETETGSEDVTIKFPSEAVKGLIMNGAEKVLYRILAKRQESRTLSFLKIVQNTLCRVEYVTEPDASRSSSTLKKAGLTKIQANVNLDEVMNLQVETTEGGEEPIDWEALTLQVEMGYVLKSGAYDYVKYAGQPWFADPSLLNEDDLSSNNTLKNIEMLSEFKQRKDHITQIHAKYIEKHPELRKIMADYLQLVLHRKPDDVYAFTKTWLN
ncbi:hypothetical protein HDV05_002413 [Chytridiales sp. JEL 0842]|nr:hypothetical protein HDV05_002413 [Chytridiales sp. JEL 0842]